MSGDLARALDLVSLGLAAAAAACAWRSCRWLRRHEVAAPEAGAPHAAAPGAPAARDDTPPLAPPSISLLVPARNEAANVAACVAGLVAQDHPALEILLLDDDSTDDTAARARAAFAHAPAGLPWRVVAGDGPPPGWTGKTFACQRLAELARGDWLLFLDADTRLAPAAARHALAAARAIGADLVSFLPRYQGAHWFDRLVVPWLYYLLIALVPLPEVARLRHPRLAVGNGQALLMRREAYRRLGGHAAVRAHVIEDVSIAIAAKQRGIAIALLDGSRWLGCEMYAGLADGIAGFRKNFHSAARLYPLQWLALVTALALLGVWPWLRLANGIGRLSEAAAPGSAELAALGAAALTTLTFAALMLRFRQHPAAIACWPLSLAGLLGIALAGGTAALLGRPVRWRGRAIDGPGGAAPGEERLA